MTHAYIHRPTTGNTVAIGRFNANGPEGYAPVYNDGTHGPTYATRDEAEAAYTLDTVKANTERYQQSYARTKAHIQEKNLTTPILHAIATDEDINDHTPEYRGIIAAYKDAYTQQTAQPNDPGYYPR